MSRRAALVFPTGYQANLGMLAGLAGAEDVILHRCRLAIQHLRRLPAQRRHRRPLPPQRSRRPRPASAALAGQGDCKLIVVEGIYSMLGDQRAARRVRRGQAAARAYLLVDEAHSLGVLGEHGRGLAEAAGRRGRGRLHRRHLQQEPGRGRRLLRLRPPGVRRPAVLQPALHVHGIVLPRRASPRCARRSGDREAARAAARLWANARRAVRRADRAAASRARRRARSLPSACRTRRRRSGPGTGCSSRHLRQSRAAARHAERRLPAALQRVGGAHTGPDRRSLSPLRPGAAELNRPGRTGAARGLAEPSDQRKPPAAVEPPEQGAGGEDRMTLLPRSSARIGRRSDARFPDQIGRAVLEGER